MYSAASGKSTLGIPRKVGAEFVAADKPGKLPKYKNEEKGERKKDSERKERPSYGPLRNLGKGGY
jgi:hypothetical protein